MQPCRHVKRIPSISIEDSIPSECDQGLNSRPFVHTLFSTIRSVAPLADNRNALSWEDARCVVIESFQHSALRPQTEIVPLTQARGRIVAADITADRDYPALDRSLRDGFAVRASDVPGSLTVLGELRAGETEGYGISVGQAIEIMTGAPVPEGADAIVMVEHVERDNEMVRVPVAAKSGQFINLRAAEAKKGSVLVGAGTRLDSSHVGTLAMTGHSGVSVFRKPSVAILATGDEIVDVSDAPKPHQIRNSNSYSLASLVIAAGGKAAILPVALDSHERLLPLLERGLAYDMLLVTGGVSAGKYDLVKPCLRELGAQFLFERVRIQPGQPTAFGAVNGKFVFGLPGNPGSSMVTFQLFARAALELLAGQTEPRLPIVYAQLESAFQHKPGLTRFLPARLRENGRLQHVPWQGSSDVPALARSNVFLIADHDRERWEPGDFIRIMPKS